MKPEIKQLINSLFPSVDIDSLDKKEREAIIRKVYKKRYYQKHHDKIREYRLNNTTKAKDYRDANKDKAKAYRAANQNKLIDYHKQYREAYNKIEPVNDDSIPTLKEYKYTQSRIRKTNRMIDYLFN